MNIRALVIAATIPAALTFATPAQAADAKPCRNVAPNSSAAASCEDRGWVIEGDFAITPRRWVARNELGPCAAPVDGDTNCYLTADSAGATYDNRGEVRYSKYSGYRLVQYVKGFRR